MSNQPLVARSSKKKLSQFLSAALAFTTTVSLSGFALLFAVTASAQVATLSDGDLVRGPDGIKVYIVKPMPRGMYSGWKRHIFNPAVFNMYGHLKWSNIKSVNQATIDAYHTSDLYRADGDAKVYSLTESGSSATKRWIENEAAFTANGYSWDQIFIVNKTEKDYYAEGPMITTTTTPTTPTTPVATGTGLTVALASNTPAAGSLVSGLAAADGAQAQANMLAVNFSAGSDGDVKVTTLKVKRNGISADADIANAYLYDGETRLADMTNISNTVVTFTNSAGLFTVAKGTTKTVWLKMDLTNPTSAGKTIAFSINSASDVVAGTATVSGSFPIMGNNMTTAAVSDLGKVVIANVGTVSATVDPGQNGYEVWKFSIAATNQKVNVSSIKLTNVGSVATTDLANIKLMDGATQVGATVATLAADATASFNLSTPLVLTAGQTKNISVMADIVGGTNRTFRFSIQREADFVAMDNNYGVSLRPNPAGFTVIQASGTTTVNAGSLTIAVDPASPTGNVAAGNTDQEFARFTFKASGEAIKVSSLTASSTGTTAGGLNDAKLYLDGTQVGSTNDLPANASKEFTFGNSFIIPSGATKVLVIKADVKNAAGVAYAAGSSLKVSLVVGASNAQGQTSLQSINTSAANGNTLTVQVGTMTVAKSTALGDAIATLPTGVKGAMGARIASFVLTAGSGESVTVSQIVLKNSATAGLALGHDFQNLMIKNGSTQIGTTIGSLSTVAGNTYTFSPSPTIQIAAGQQYVVDVYADVLTGASNYQGQSGYAAYSAVTLDSVTATGNATNNDASDTTTKPSGQKVFLAGSGSLVAAAASDMPIAQNRAMGEVGQTLATFKLTAGFEENVNVTKIIVTDLLGGTSSAATGSIINLKLFKADGTQVGSTVASMTSSVVGTNVLATFDGLTLGLTKGSATVLTLKGDMNYFPNGTSGSTHIFKIQGDGDVTAIGATSGTAIGMTGASTTTGNAQRAYRSELTVINAMTNISGGQTTDQNVGKYRFTNTSAGNYSITVSDIDLLIGSTIDVVGATKYVTLRRDSVGGTIVARKGTSAAADFVNITDWTAAAGDPCNNGAGECSFQAFTIDAAGGTGYVDIYVLADTNNAVATKNFSTTIGGTTPVTWSDGASSNITTLDNAPIAGANITY